jgi:threonine dehydrogenase-like Zn-dependent dehydrogenase
MKAIRVHEFGGPEVLKFEEVPTPKPSAGEVLVRIHAAGVNPYDTYMRAGTYAVKPTLPYTPGSDGAGVVEAVGEGVKKVRQNDHIYTARTLTGAYAEYALALHYDGKYHGRYSNSELTREVVCQDDYNDHVSSRASIIRLASAMIHSIIEPRHQNSRSFAIRRRAT